MTNKSAHRFALLSRQLLQDALIELLKEKNYPKITVTEIVSRAGLSRPTFYAHFETKDDLLLSYLDDVLSEIYAKTIENLPSKMGTDFPEKPAQIPNFYAAWLEKKEILTLIRSTGIDYLILERIRKHHRQIFLEIMSIDPHENLNPVLVEYLVNYLAGSSFMLLITWMDNGMRHSPEDLQQLQDTLFNPNNLAIVEKELNEKIT